MKKAVIEGGVVANIIEAPFGFNPPGVELVPADATARIGGTWDGAAFGPPPGPGLDEERAAMRCTLAQFRIALADAGQIAAVEARFLADPRAAVLWEYGGTIRRDSRLAAAAIAGGVTEAQIDAIFRAAMAVAE